MYHSSGHEGCLRNMIKSRRSRRTYVERKEEAETEETAPPQMVSTGPKWLDPSSRLLADLTAFEPVTEEECVEIKPVWRGKDPVFIRRNTPPTGDSESDRLKYDAETNAWQEAMIPEDEMTWQLCCELSEGADRMYRSLDQVRDYVVLYFSAAYPLLSERPKVMFRAPLRFQFGEYYSNHFIYGLAQWTVWWAWRAWQQTVYTLSRVCINGTFAWEADELDARILSDNYDLAACLPHLCYSTRLLLNLQQHFLPHWPTGVWSEVLPTEGHSVFDPVFVKTICRANAALCQLAILVDQEDYTIDWKPPQAERELQMSIRPYHQVSQQLHAIENDIDTRLMYLPEVRVLTQQLHYRAITRYAAAYHDHPMGVWAWSFVALRDQTKIPQLGIDLNSLESRRHCYEEYTALSLKPFELTPEWTERFMTPAVRVNKPLELSLFTPKPISPSKLLKFRWRLK